VGKQGIKGRHEADPVVSSLPSLIPSPSLLHLPSTTYRNTSVFGTVLGFVVSYRTRSVFHLSFVVVSSRRTQLISPSSSSSPALLTRDGPKVVECVSYIHRVPLRFSQADLNNFSRVQHHLGQSNLYELFSLPSLPSFSCSSHNLIRTQTLSSIQGLERSGLPVLTRCSRFLPLIQKKGGSTSVVLFWRRSPASTWLRDLESA